MNVIQPRQLTVLTTNTCTAACGHCSVHSSPERKGKLSAEQICNAIAEMHKAYAIRLVVFAGGEPTLLGKDLLEAFAFADSLGIGTRMVTNAHWATSEKVASNRLREFREAGLRELNISCDDYHIPYIPLERVKHAWNASKAFNFDAVVIAAASGKSSKLTPEKIKEYLDDDVPMVFDDNGLALPLPQQSCKTIRVISNSQLARLGRGEQNVTSSELTFPVDQASLEQPCRWIMTSPALSPRNSLLSCCGMEANERKHLDYGLIDETGIPSLIEKANANPVVRAVALLGPYRILEIIRSLEPEAPLWSQFSGICELCNHIFNRPSIVALVEKHIDTISLIANMAEQNVRKMVEQRVN